MLGMNPYESEDAQADKLRQQGAEALMNIDLPTLQNLNPELYKSVGDLELQGISTPDQVKYNNISSEFENIQSDPRLKNDQMAALGALQDLANNGGMNATDRANLSRIQSEAAQADRGRREAIQQGMASRGMGGSGMNLLAQLQSSQAATDRQAQQGLDIAGMAQQRALEAMMQGGQLAGNIRGQDFSEAAQRASALDHINQFNASNKLSNDWNNTNMGMDVNKFNAGINNQAATANWGNNQEIANKNVGVKNDAQKVNNIDLPQQGFQNKVTKATGVNTGMNQMASGIDKRTGEQAGRDSALINTGINAAATYYGGKK